MAAFRALQPEAWISDVRSSVTEFITHTHTHTSDMVEWPSAPDRRMASNQRQAEIVQSVIQAWIQLKSILNQGDIFLSLSLSIELRLVATLWKTKEQIAFQQANSTLESAFKRIGLVTFVAILKVPLSSSYLSRPLSLTDSFCGL